MFYLGFIDIIDFVLLTVYPVGALFIIEILSRAISRILRLVFSWLKLLVQGVTMIGFTVAYIVFMSFFTNTDKVHNVEPYTIIVLCLLALVGALFFQARRVKINPEKSLY